MKCLDGIVDSLDMNLVEPQEMMRDKKAWHNLLTEQQKNMLIIK